MMTANKKNGESFPKRFSSIRKQHATPRFLHLEYSGNKFMCMYSSKRLVKNVQKKPFTSENEMKRNIKTNVWNINNTLRTITLNHIRLCVHMLMRIKYGLIFHMMAYALGTSASLFFSYCFSVELIKIKSSIQMIKTEHSFARWRRHGLAFFNYDL